MAIRIPGAHNPVNQIDLEIELANGEVLAFTVPKYEYIAKSVMEKYEPWLEEWNARAALTGDGAAEAQAGMHDTDPIVHLLELLLPKATSTKLAKLTRGEIMAIDQHWTKESGVTLGESEASSES